MHGASMQATKEEKVETKEENEDGAESNVCISKVHKEPVLEGDAEAPYEALGLDTLELHKQ